VPSAAYGALCGWVLGESEVAYIILAIPVAILLQLLVGLEHRNRGEAAARGFVAGACFGGFILIVNQLLIDTEPKFHIQDPKWQLAIVTAVFGAGLAWLGAGLRGQLEQPGRYLDPSRVSPAEPRLALGRLAPLGRVLGDPRLGMAGAFLSLRRVLPDRYPLELDVDRYIADEQRLGRMLDYAVIVPRLQRLFEWSAQELGEPRLAELVREGNPIYAWSFEQRHVWRTPRMPFAARVLERATRAR
jgi:hypothetical protein